MPLVLLRHFSSFCLFGFCTCPLLSLPARLLAPDAMTSDSLPLLQQPLSLLSLSLARLAAFFASSCLAVLVCTSEIWGLGINVFICFLILFQHTLTKTDIHTHTHTHTLTQLIRPSHAHSSGRMWPCLIVYHAHLFSLHDVTIAYLFSSGLPSHIKMIDSFHSLHIVKLYLISSFPLAFKSLLFPVLKSYNVTGAHYYSYSVLFLQLIICVRK